METFDSVLCWRCLDCLNMGLALDELFLGERTNPNIAIADRVSMILQTERLLQWMGRIFRSRRMIGRAEHFDVILNEQAIVQHREGGGCGGVVSLFGPAG